MKGTISEGVEKSYTHLKKVFDSIDNVQKNYNWLISSYECYCYDEKYADLFEKDFFIVSGEQLTEMIGANDGQWIWGVFSAFPKDISEDEILKYELPWADGNGVFWQNPVSIQHPLAEIEIVAFDAGMMMLISRDDKIAERYMENNPLAEDLHEYNEKI